MIEPDLRSQIKPFPYEGLHRLNEIAKAWLKKLVVPNFLVFLWLLTLELKLQSIICNENDAKGNKSNNIRLFLNKSQIAHDYYLFADRQSPTQVSIFLLTSWPSDFGDTIVSDPTTLIVVVFSVNNPFCMVFRVNCFCRLLFCKNDRQWYSNE